MKKKKKTEIRTARDLLASVPESSYSGVFISAFVYDLDLDGGVTDGIAVVTEDGIFVYERGSFVRSVLFSDAAELEFMTLVGACEIVASTDGGPVIVCRGTLRCSDVMAKNVRRIVRFRETGKYPTDGELGADRVCPKCGRRLRPGMNTCVNCADKGSVLKRTLGMARPYRKYIVLSVLLFFAGFAVNLLGPYVNRLLVDGYIDSETAKAAVAGGEGGVVFRGFALTICLMAGLGLSGYVINSLRNLSVMEAGVRLVVDLRRTVFDKIEKMSVRTLSRRSSGELMRTVTWDTSMIERFITVDAPNLIQQSFLMIAVFAILMIKDPVLALIIVVPIPACLLVGVRVSGMFRRMYHRQWHASSESGTVLHDIFLSLIHI